MFQQITINKTRKYVLNTKECKISAIKNQITRRKNFIVHIEEINKNIFFILSKILEQKNFNRLTLYLHYINFIHTDPELLKSCIRILYDISGINILFVFDRNLMGKSVPFYEFRC